MNRNSPLIAKILDVLLPPDLHHLVGDLEEEFHQNKEYYGKVRAYLYLWSQVLCTLPWFFFQSLIWNTVMIINYLKVTWRNIKKHKSFSLINILGLAISMSICLLIILFLVDQKSYDRFHEHSDRIYRVISDFKSPGNNISDLYATTPADMADLLELNFPAIQNVTRVRDGFSGEIRFKDKIIPLQGMYADSSFLQIFNFDLLKGNPQTALSNPGSIVLTPESARKIFGEAEAIGKTVSALGGRDYIVTGIIDDDVKSHFRFGSLVSYATLEADAKASKRLKNWKESIYDSYTYLLLHDEANAGAIESRLPSLIPTHYSDPEAKNIVKSFSLQGLTEINLGPPLSNEIGWVFPGIIAWFLVAFGTVIILIASFNYVSLTVARAINRTKEVGIRKVMGAYRSNVIKQFLAESVIIALMALIFATAALRWLLPEFNSLTLVSMSESQIDFNFLADYGVFTLFILFSIVVGIFAGFYPALYLSSFNPARVLKGISRARGLSGPLLRKIIVVTQFSFSILFIITSLILIKQFNHMMNTDYGFNQEHVINIALQDVPYDRFRSALSSNPNVETIAATTKIPALGSISGRWLKSDSLAEPIRGHSFNLDEHYIKAMGLNLVAGRNFNPELASDSTSSVILSDQAVSRLGLGSPSEAIGHPVKVNEQHYTVIGVIENFISADPMRRGDPIVMFYNPGNYYYAVVKVRPETTGEFIFSLNETWSDLGSLYSLKFEIFDQQLEENPILLVFFDFLKVLGLLSVFSVVISCLGLLGMAMYSAENRVKEIGIRKVLGASVQNIVLLLSREYLLLVALAVAIGTPMAWFVNSLWMQQVSNKVDIGLLVYLAGIIGTIILALLTICSQTIRAAQTKPVTNLQKE